jgi:hypothetical protein
LWVAASRFSISPSNSSLKLADKAAAHLFYRWVYFKTLWVGLNAGSPLYCFKGLFFKTLSKSGPIMVDRVTVRDWLEYLLRSFKERTADRECAKGQSQHDGSKSPHGSELANAECSHQHHEQTIAMQVDFGLPRLQWDAF